MKYKSIHTTLGLQLMTQAEATGTQIRLTHIAVGDGNGNFVTPSESQTALVRERFRTPINRVWQQHDSPNMFSAEVIIPTNVGGFTMREIGVFDSNGNLFVVGNMPDTYKPTGSDGAYSDTVIRVDFMVTNTSVVQMIIDPNVVIATHQWIINNVTPAMLFPGGTTHQVLRKKTNADGDAEWADPTDINVTVNSIEETQTLAAAQTVIDWAELNNTGLCVYVEGVRLRADQWTKHATINTRITLSQSYPAGTKVVGTQNEPAATLPDPLVKSQNLADVPNKNTARTNLDVFSKAETRQMAQPGLVAYYALTIAPPGWLKANGAAISRSVYADLFASIGTAFGNGDGFNTFNIPDLRGEFVRGWDDARGIDSGRSLGTAQADQIKLHDHGLMTETGVPGSDMTMNDNGIWRHGTTANNWAIDQNGSARAVATFPTGGPETRPRNISLLACIKY